MIERGFALVIWIVWNNCHGVLKCTDIWFRMLDVIGLDP